MKNVTLVISCFEWNTGAGGHYYSYQALADALQGTVQLRLITVGTQFPQALDAIKDSVSFVQGAFGPDARHALESHLSALEGTDCVIAMDTTAAMLMRRHCRRTRTGLIMVKAGGPWPKRYVPNTNVQVHFSLKDHQRAQRRLAGGPGKSFYIPNRVQPIASTTPDATALAEELALEPDEIIIIRIGRVAEVYRASFEGALALRRVLTDAGYKARTIMIGTPEKPELAAELVAACMPGRDHFFTDKDFTRAASRFLPIAQINVGVGRGFMEGASLGQHMFAIANNGGLPVRVTDETMPTFLEENISMRVRLARPEAQRKADILAAAAAIRAGEATDARAKEWFETWFSAAQIPSLYMQAIEAAQTLPDRHCCDSFINDVWLRLAPLEERVHTFRRKRAGS